MKLETLRELNERAAREAEDIKAMSLPNYRGTKTLKDDEGFIMELIEQFGEDLIMDSDLSQWININDPTTRDDFGELVQADAEIPLVTPTEEEIQAELDRMIENAKERSRINERNQRKAEVVAVIKGKLKEKEKIINAQLERTEAVNMAKRQRERNAQDEAKELYKVILQREEKEAQEAAARAQAEEELAAIEAKRKTLLQRIGIQR